MKSFLCFLSFLLIIFSRNSFSASIKVGMITDVGGINDQSFNQSAWEGLKKAVADFGIKAKYLESKQDSDYMTHLETHLEAKQDLIWGIGFKMADAILKAAKENPQQKYGIIDYSYGDKTPKNVICVMFKAEEGAFLAGFVASKKSKTQTLGFIGGMSVPIIHSFQYGFKAGAYYANKKINVLEQYSESFSDVAKGKAMANSLLIKNADVLFHAAGAVGDGVIEAVKEKNKFVIGVDRDQNYLAPKNVITSSLKRVDRAIYQVVADLTKGKFEGGKTISFGLKDGGVDIAETGQHFNREPFFKELQSLKRNIIAQKLTPPKNEAEFKQFIKVIK